MKTFTLPDGREIYIPDDPNLRAEVGYALSQIPEYGPDVAKEYTEGTFIGQSIEALKSVPRGIAQTTLMGLRGPIEALAQDSLGEGPLVRLADKMKATEERIAQNIAGYRDPRYADAFSTKAGQAVGSLIPFVALGAASRGKSTKYMPVFKPGTKGFGKVNPLNFNAKFLTSKPFLYPAGLGSSVYMSQNADMMDIAEEVYGEEKPGFFAENLSTLTSSVIGATEALPIFNFFRSIPKSALRDATTSQKIFAHAKNFTAGFVQEGLQESTAGLLQDLNARGFYSDELPIGESLFDDFTVGGFAGGLLNTVIQGYGGRRGIASEYRAEQEKRAEKKKQDLLRTKTFDIAQQQGVIDIADPTQDINVQETLLLPLLDNVPKPVETSTPPQLQIRKNQNNTFSLIDNNLGEVDTFNKEVDAINKKEQLLKDFEVNLQKQILDNDLYILGLNKSSSAYELAQTVMDTDTTTASLKEIVPYDSSLKNVQAMQNVLLGKNKKYKKLPLKESYTLTEVKQLLSAKDFNTFITDMSQQVAKNSKYPSVIENNNKTNVTIKRLKEIGNSKNINIDVNDAAFQYAAKRLTGTSSFAKMTKPQKELLLARIQSLPRFNTKIDFPNLQPRIYSAQDVSETVSNLKNSKALFNKQSLKMIGIKDPQFFEDLVYSGRAEKVKGNQYKIADNFQEKIDRRADAFNETTEEFVNRLVTEGKLSSEAIAQLEQEQNNKESQQLPPVEEAKRTIDFAEAVEKGRINKFAQELRQRLAKVGLKETGVIVSDEILSTGALEQTADGSIRFVGRDKTVKAEYDRQTDIIFISLNAVNPNGTSTDADIQRKLNEILDHELIHALREKDLINEKEYDYLRKQVKKVRVPKSVDKIAFDKKETYFDRAKRINEPTIAEEQQPTPTKAPIFRSPAEINEFYTEEAIAEMYRNRKVESPLPERAEGIFNKIIEFFAELGESLRISGFDNANQIFEEIEAGRIGKRTRGKIRTTKLLDKGPPPTIGKVLDEVEDDYLDTPLFSKRGPRDETSGHVADYVPAQYGPPAHDLNEMPSEEFTPEGYSTFGADVDYNNLRIFSTARTEIQQQEEREFINKLIEIKDNPNAEITVYQAAPSRDLREGDLITPFLSDAQYLVDESKITRKEIREADKARRRAEGVVNLQQEKNFEAIDRIIDMFDMPDVTPSKVHTYKLRAGDIRWDGNNGWARWGYFPRIKPVDDIPTFSREADQAYFDREKRKRTISNLESSIEFKQAQLDAERGTMTDSSAKRLEREIKNQRQKIADLKAGDLPTFSRAYKPGPAKKIKNLDGTIVPGAYEYRGFVIEETGRYSELPGPAWKFAKIPEGLTALEALSKFDIFEDQTNSLYEAKEFIDRVYFGEDTGFELPTFSRTNLIPEDIEVPFNWASNNRFETGAILDQLIKSRISGTRDNPGPLKMAIVDAFKGKNNRPLLKASKKFLEKFTNKKGNLVLFRALNIPEGEKIKNYGQLPQDLFASTTLDSRQALKISRNLFTKAQSQGATWNPEILRYEVPMNKVKGYVPMLLKAMESDFITEFESDMAGSGIMSQEELDAAIEEADAKGDFYKYQGEQTTEELLADAIFEYNGFQEEAEVLADLRGIKPTYQYSPATKDRQASLINDVPLFSRGRRDNKTPNKALEEVIETVNNTARGGIPVYNLNASDTALEAAKEFIEDEGALPPDDIPTFLKNLDGVDPSIVEGINSTGSRTTPKNSMGYRFIDVAKDNISGKLQYFYNNMREQIIDKADKAQKAIIKMSEENEQVRRLNNTADTSTMAAIRLMDRARGIFQGMLNTGYVTDTVDGALSLVNTVPLSISTRYNPFIEGDTGTGGLMQILAPLYSTETDLESIFKYYALLKRKQGFDKSGRKIETPITEKNLNDIRKIQSNYPVVVEAYQNYQRWNNRLIDFAVAKGLLSKTRNISELAEDISAITKENENDLIQLSYEELMNKVNVLNKELSADKQIETRGTAQIWKENSDYYPFYRKMTDDTVAGPNIASGSLPNNPLSIKIEGSKEQIDVDVIEAISRNSLAILTAAMKNDGTAKLIRDMQIYGTARPISPVEISKNPKIKNNLDVVAVFNNGQKNYYEVENIEAFNVFKEVGGTPTGVLTNIFGGASSLLRDTVTRDPGFIAVNLLRDSLSTMVTSGANYTPIIDTFKSMGKDMAELEKFGVIGGYDFQNDEGSIKRYLKRNMRLSGLTNENGMSAKKAFFMLWDGLGNLTTKSDGATRLAVYNAVYKKLKEEGATEAQAQSEAAFQALEIINFGRRGANPAFRFITAAIPFLNARVQGLDVLWRSSTGQYSAVEKLGKNETINDVKRRIQINMATNAGILIAITFAYYMMMHDDDEYKNLKREVRDDNWVLPIFKDYAVKIPVPFEVGFLFKTVPERLFDFTLGDDAFSKKSGQELITSTRRGLKTSLSIDTPQLIKPLLEVIYNRNSYTGQEIVPYYQQKKAPGLQARPTTNYLVKEIAEFLNISPAKAEHFIRGYTGTLGGHVLSVIDVASRGATGEDILPSNVSLNRIPLFNRVLMNTDKAGGLQQQFYELRNEVDGMTQTLNSLKKAGRMDEYYAYRNSMQGVLNVKNQVRKMERYLAKWRERRDKILQNKNMSLTAKQDALERLELERDRRLAMVPELRKRANIPITHMGTF